MTKQPDDQAKQQIDRVLGEMERPFDAAAEAPLTPDLHPDRTRRFRSVNFSRMRTRWPADQQADIDFILAQVERELQERFKNAFDLRSRIWLCVRIPQMQGDEVLADIHGNPKWECHPNGTPVEDWSRLGDRQRDDFIHEVSVWMFEWELESVKAWTEAMYGKGGWEGVFASNYLNSPGKTIDDRTQEGTHGSMEERYHAIYLSALSRGGDAIVKSMDRILRTLERTAR